ncbi:hypothetical protein imdm_378 [gamma proteobacterium IMCC2047]|nr:hypothetical protein imdm_378 [gamma proteobacterium IMCC2047]
MDIPYQAIPKETLSNMIEEFVTRDGTDYGECELSLEEKVVQVMSLLKQGKAAIQYDESMEICEIVLLT